MPDLDDLLRSDIAGAAARSAEPPELATVLARGRRRRNRTRAALAAACTLGMLGAGGVLLGGQRLTTAPADPRPSPPGVTGAAEVPWAPLPPTYPSIPRHTVPPQPDPAQAEAAPPCRASDLRATSGLGAALGTEYLRIVLRAAGQRRCRLEGHPAVTLLENARPVAVPTVPSTGDDRTFNYPDPVLVRPGTPARLMLSWASLWCSAPVLTDQVLVSLPGGRGGFTVHGFGRSPACNGTPGAGPTPVGVAAFAPWRSTPARVVSTYAGVAVTTHRTSPPRPGRPLDFTVTLRAPRTVVLDPCPDYTVGQYLPDGRSKQDRYALNCAAVPTKDAEGRPFLPAGTPVTFAMWTVLLGAGNGMKFSWQLQVPDDGVAGAGLLVSGAGPR